VDHLPPASSSPVLVIIRLNQQRIYNMAKDMMERLLEGLVDYVLAKSGQTKESLGQGINAFMEFGRGAGEAMARIEHNQILLMEAENERRKSAGKPPLSAVYPPNYNNSGGNTSIQ